MGIYGINPGNIPTLARFMARIKPDWWDYEGATEQLSDIRTMVANVGWLMGEDEEHPKGWVLCAEYACYSCLSIECLGYDENGRFVMEEQLQPLLEHAENYARGKGLRTLKYIIGSRDLSIHGRELGDYGEELKILKSYGRAHFDYFIRYGFKAAGFMPHCLGDKYHGIVMIKELK